jgi:uncharacterized membrane protein YeiH
VAVQSAICLWREFQPYLRADVYATAALAGSVIMILGRKLRSPAWSALFGGVACFLLRVVSVWLHWNLPRVIER